MKSIRDDVNRKPYAVRARQIDYTSEQLLTDVLKIVAKEKKSLAGAIISVAEKRGVLVIRARSHVAMSELLPLRDEIQRGVKRPSVSHVRFTV